MSRRILFIILAVLIVAGGAVTVALFGRFDRQAPLANRQAFVMPSDPARRAELIRRGEYLRAQAIALHAIPRAAASRSPADWRCQRHSAPCIRRTSRQMMRPALAHGALEIFTGRCTPGAVKMAVFSIQPFHFQVIPALRALIRTRFMPTCVPKQPFTSPTAPTKCSFRSASAPC